jgi:peptidoglycan/LPS O-acetylase OafA/YrhL
MVFLVHYGYMMVPARSVEFLWVGVDLFFVLSGFLITGILCDSVDSPTYFRDFYTRRALRIFPLYYGFYFCVILLTPVLHLHYDGVVIWGNMLYVMNFVMRHAVEHHNPTILTIGHLQPPVELGVVWSLCVEEHFYLVWPWVVRYFRGRRRALIVVCLIGVLAVMTLRTVLFLHDPGEALQTRYLYFATYSRCDTLLLGAFLALCLREYRITPQRFRALATSAIAVGIAAIGIGLALNHTPVAKDSGHPVFATYGYTFVGIAAVGVVMLAIDDASLLSRIFRTRWLARLGTISYGMYFLHCLPLAFFGSIRAARFHLSGLVVLAAFACTYAAAYLSYRYLESPFLRLKDRFAPPVVHETTPAPAEALIRLAA